MSGFGKRHEIPCSVWEIQVKNYSGDTSPDVLTRRIYTTNIGEPWTARQLMAPADLAAMINDPNSKKPVIICVGPGALIKGSLDMGPAKEKENLEKLKQQLIKLSRDANVVIYCGCCPFEHCPNIRPAFTLINEMKFSNAHLLNIEHNINTDWIAKGFPKAKS
jgi:hypothetical protein